ARRKPVEEPIGFFLAGWMERDIDVVASHELLPQGLERVGGHEHLAVADWQADVHDPVLLFIRNGDALHGHVAEAGQVAELATENGLVEIEGLFRFAGEVEVHVHFSHGLSRVGDWEYGMMESSKA